jgi:serine/threonine-protein kinase
VLAGKYRIERLIGSGGTGVVAQATHLKLERQVALKLLRSDLSDSPEIVARFAREARAAARLKGEHVTRILDVGELDDGTPYLVMEFLEGSDFRALLGEGRRLGITDAVDYVLQACEAVAEAHAAGIVHRDLKPANLFLTHAPDRAPLVKVLDFGISKAVTGVEEEEAIALTSSASVMGTPLYMSPEQMKNAREVDARTDLWALGAILYEFVAGRPPFVARSLPELCVMLLQQDPVPLRLLRPEVPEQLARVIERCLRKNRVDRYRDVADLAQALALHASPPARLRVERIARLSGRPTPMVEAIDVGARAVRPSDTGVPCAARTPPSTEPPSPAEVRGPPPRAVQHGRWLWGAAAVVMVGVGIVLGVGGVSRSLRSTAEPSGITSAGPSAEPGSSFGSAGTSLGPLVVPVPSTSSSPVSIVAGERPGQVVPSPARPVHSHAPSASAAPNAHGPDRLLTDRE